MPYSEDELLRQGFVPEGIQPKTIGPTGEATWQGEGGQMAGVLSNALGSLFQSMQVAQERKQKKFKDQLDMYKTLRDAGYDPQAAHSAVQKMQLLPQPGGVDLDEEKKRADLGLTKAKTDYYNKGGSRRTVIDQMTPNQLQGRLKFLTDSGEDDEETKQEISSITNKLRELTMKSTQGVTPQATGSVVMTGPDGKKYKIPRENIEKAKQKGFVA